MKKSRSRSRSHSHSREQKRKTSFSNRDNSNERGIKLYLSNLGSTVSERKIKEEFENFGDVLNYSLKRKNGKTSNYFGYVVMKNKTDAERAMHHISKSLGWKITLYDTTESYSHYNRDRSFSRSSSKSPSDVDKDRDKGDRDRSRERERSRERDRDKDKDRDSQLISNNNSFPNKALANTLTNIDGLHTVKVREIFVKNLPENITQSTLYKTFFIYGEIARIDVNQEKLFGFIRYRLCASASRAYEKAKNMNLGGKVIRVSFSDSGKRKEIIGDENGFELNEKTCKLLHVSLNKNSTVAQDQVIKDVFSKYGSIKAIHSKSSPGFRPSIYVEFSSPEDAEKAVNEMNSETNSDKRKLLGDPFCDINYYFKKKIYPVEGMNNTMPNNNMNVNNMMNPNQNIMMSKMNPMYPPNMMYPNPMMNQMMYYQMMQRNQMLQQSIASSQNQQYKAQTQQQAPMQPQPQANSNEANKMLMPPFIQPPSIPMINQYPYPYMRPPMMYPYSMQAKPTITPPTQPTTAATATGSTSLTEVKDMLQEALKSIKTEASINNNSNSNNNNASKSDKESDISSLREEAELDFEKEYSLEEENLKNIWSGYLTKNKRDRILVDAYHIRGNISEPFTESALNVSHRTQYDEIMKRPILGIIAISPESVTQCDLFQDYINYFNEKQRVGVINTASKSTLYLVPPCEFSRKFYQNPKKHLLGILVDSTKEPKSYVDMSNLSLPPSVISTTEKKLLAKQQKKNTQVTDTPQQNATGLNLSELGFDQTLLNQLKELDSNKMTIKERTDLINNNPKLKALLSNINIPNLNQQDEQ